MGTAKSFLLVTVDCLRADHCGFNAYGRPTTPFLDALAGDSYVFTNAIAAGVPTYYSLPSLLASRYPLAWGRDVIGIAPGEPTLASALRGAGHATACFSAANPYVSPQSGYDQGFQTFRDFLEAPIPASHHLTEPENTLRSGGNRHLAAISRRLGLGPIYDELYFHYCQKIAAPPADSLDSLRRFPSADVIVDHALSWLRRAQGPFFLWLHLMDPHSPYYPTDGGAELMGDRRITASQARYLNSYWNRGDLDRGRLETRRENVVRLYDACIRWVDAQLERLCQGLRELTVWDDCVLAVTADHGEEFLEHGGRYHAPSKLTEELVNVPLLLRVPGAPAVRATSPFSLIHLAPTVLDALGVAIPPAFAGASCQAQLRRGENWNLPAITECVSDCRNPMNSENRNGPRLLAVRDQGHKLIIDFRTGDFETSEERLFDLDSDPDECTPLAPDSAVATRRHLLQIARRHLESSRAKTNSPVRVGVRLRDMKREIMGRSAIPQGAQIYDLKGA